MVVATLYIYILERERERLHRVFPCSIILKEIPVFTFKVSNLSTNVKMKITLTLNPCPKLVDAQNKNHALLFLLLLNLIEEAKLNNHSTYILQIWQKIGFHETQCSEV